MAHPPRFDPADPLLHRLREICLDLPEAAEKISHGFPAFYTVKVFAMFGGVVKGDHASDVYARSVLVLPDADEREALLADRHFFVPGYVGAFGWIGRHLAAAPPDWDEPDWAEIAELVDMSYRNTAPARLVRLLDSRAS